MESPIFNPRSPIFEEQERRKAQSLSQPSRLIHYNEKREEGLDMTCIKPTLIRHGHQVDTSS